MLKSILLGGFIGVSLILTPVVAHSQAQQLTSQSATSTTATNNITPLELRQFAQVIQQWQVIDTETQKKMPQAIKDEGMSVERFVEIGKFKDNPSSSTTITISPEEEEKFQKIVVRFQELQKGAEPKKKRAITAQGLSIQRFTEIIQVVQNDPTLKKRVQEMIAQ